MKGVSFYALGGLDENGKNCYVLETQNQIFIINSGAKVPITSHYGVDTITPNIDYLKKNKDKIVGIFITDTKNDSFSALPWFLMQLPKMNIYTNPFNVLTISNRIQKYKLDLTNVNVKSFVRPEKFGDVLVKPFQLFGAIPGTIGLNFETSEGSFVFMHNFVCGRSDLFGSTDLDFIKKTITKRPLSLIMDVGKSQFKGYANDKIHAPENIKEIIKKTPQNERIVVAAYDEEMTTLLELIELAHELNRPIIIYGKSFYEQFKLLNNKYFIDKKPFLADVKITDYRKMPKSNNAIIFVTATVEVLYQRFIRIADNQDIFLKLKHNDNVIFLAPPINGIESMAAMTLDKIAHITRKLTVASESDRYQHRPAEEDLKAVVAALKPDYFIPVQGLFRNQVVSIKKLAPFGYNPNNSLILSNGKVAYFEGGKLMNRNKKIAPVGDQIIDGYGLGDVSSEVISEREKLAREGVVTITAIIDKQKHLTGKIRVEFVGLGSDNIRTELDEIVRTSFVKNYYESRFGSYPELQKTLRNRVRKSIFKKIQKEPTVIVTLYRA